MLDFEADVYFAQDVTVVLKKAIDEHAAKSGIDAQKYAARFELVPAVDRVGNQCHRLECKLRMIKM